MNRPMGRYQFNPSRRNNNVWNPPEYFDFEETGRDSYVDGRVSDMYMCPSSRPIECREEFAYRSPYSNSHPRAPPQEKRDRDSAMKDQRFIMNTSLDNIRFRSPEEDYSMGGRSLCSTYKNLQSPYRSSNEQQSMNFEDEHYREISMRSNRGPFNNTEFQLQDPHRTIYRRFMPNECENFGSEMKFMPSKLSPSSNSMNIRTDDAPFIERPDRSSVNDYNAQNNIRLIPENQEEKPRSKRMIQLEVKTSKQNRSSQPSLQLMQPSNPPFARKRASIPDTKTVSKSKFSQQSTKISNSSIDAGTRLLTVPLHQLMPVSKSLAKVRPRVSVIFEVCGHVTAVFNCGVSNQLSTRFQLVDTRNSMPLDCIFYDIDGVRMTTKLYDGSLFWCVGRYLSDKNLFQCVSIRPVSPEDNKLSRMLYILSNDVVKELTSQNSVSFEKEA